MLTLSKAYIFSKENFMKKKFKLFSFQFLKPIENRLYYLHRQAL